MANKFDSSSNIGDIVSIYPGASNLFLEYRIDFCCGGDRPLKEAIDEKKLNEEEIVTLLNERYKEFIDRNEEFTDWANEDPGKLADYIEGKHHRYLHEELPKINEFVLKILKVHGKSHIELYKVHKLFSALKTELEGHLIKEETILFPNIKKYEVDKNSDLKRDISNLIEDLEKEHVGAGDIIKELREVTGHYIAPKDGCRSFQLTYQKLKELEEDIFQHIHLENNILFKKYI